jgi:hypothetical protein
MVHVWYAIISTFFLWVFFGMSMVIVGCSLNVEFIGLIRMSLLHRNLPLATTLPNLYPPPYGKCNKGDNNLLATTWDGQRES